MPLVSTYVKFARSLGVRAKLSRKIKRQSRKRSYEKTTDVLIPSLQLILISLIMLKSFFSAVVIAEGLPFSREFLRREATVESGKWIGKMNQLPYQTNDKNRPLLIHKATGPE
jgi:hypothetical protein